MMDALPPFKIHPDEIQRNQVLLLFNKDNIEICIFGIDAAN
jgi:hypothetical protein